MTNLSTKTLCKVITWFWINQETLCPPLYWKVLLTIRNIVHGYKRVQYCTVSIGNDKLHIYIKENDSICSLRQAQTKKISTNLPQNTMICHCISESFRSITFCHGSYCDVIAIFFLPGRLLVLQIKLSSLEMSAFIIKLSDSVKWLFWLFWGLTYHRKQHSQLQKIAI